MRKCLWILLVSALGLAIPVRISGDCTPAPVFRGYSFINPYIVDLHSSLADFFLDFDVLSTLRQPQQRVQIENNLTEWWERFCKRPTLPDIGAVVYQATIDDLRDLLSAITSEKVPLSYLRPVVAENSFVKYLYRHQCTETVEYLIYAKRCEPHVTPVSSWEERRQDRTAMRELIRQGEAAFMRAESHYIRLRYAYQMIRLAHYLKDFDYTLQLYDYLMPKIDHDPSLIEYWIDGHRAGALMGLGRNVEASYIYSRIFEKCPSKRESAYRSFRIRTDEEWQELSLLCRSDHERAVLHVLRANQENSRLIEEMWHIYGYEPENRQLEYLALRELRRLEKDLLGLEFNDYREQNRRYLNIPRPIAGQRVIDLQTFVRRVQADGRAARPAFWQLLEGYLELLAGDYYYAAKTFETVADQTRNDTLLHQLNVWQTILQILQLPEEIDEAERQASAIQKTALYTQYPDMADFMRDRFTILYQQGSNAGKAFMSQYTLYDLQLNPQMNIIDDLLSIIQQQRRNRFEKTMVERPDGTTIEPELIDLKSSLQLSQNMPEAAMETLKQLPSTEWDNLDPGLYIPFVERLNDCVHGCQVPDSLTQYNKGELIQYLMDLEYRARSTGEPTQAANFYYKMGLAYYNMTYFGPAWQILDEFRSGSSLQRHRRGDQNMVVPYRDVALGNREFFDCSRARYLFQRARTLSEDPELAARATFMEAKCEQNDYYVFAPPNTVQSRTAFDILQNNYADTRFYQQAIRECKYFRTYVTN